MIKASDLKVGDKICSVNGIEYEVIENHIGDVLFIINKRDTTKECIAGLHLFYDDIGGNKELLGLIESKAKNVEYIKYD